MSYAYASDDDGGAGNRLPGFPQFDSSFKFSSHIGGLDILSPAKF